MGWEQNCLRCCFFSGWSPSLWLVSLPRTGLPPSDWSPSLWLVSLPLAGLPPSGWSPSRLLADLFLHCPRSKEWSVPRQGSICWELLVLHVRKSWLSSTPKQSGDLVARTDWPNRTFSWHCHRSGQSGRKQRFVFSLFVLGVYFSRWFVSCFSFAGVYSKPGCQTHARSCEHLANTCPFMWTFGKHTQTEVKVLFWGWKKVIIF